MRGYTLRVKFVFWSAAIKVALCEKNESRRALTHRLNNNNDPFVNNNNDPFVVVEAMTS